MPPLVAKWNTLKDEDKDLFPLLEVFGTLLYNMCMIQPCYPIVPIVSSNCITNWFLPLL